MDADAFDSSAELLLLRMNDQPGLKRSLGFWALLIYGVGDILGAGIYALIGKIAGIAGMYAWLAFLIALLVATLTALSYAQLVARFPHSGGAAYFCQRAFHRPEPVLLVGWLVFCSGLFSMATLAHAFADYSGAIVGEVPRETLIVFFLVAVCAVNFYGIEMSSWTNVVCTVIEVSGLLIILAAGAWFIFGGNPTAMVATPTDATAPSSLVWLAVLQAGALAFYACIGFEDLVNVAEEAKQPRRDLPLALLSALGIAGLLYLLTVVVCTRVVDPAGLSESTQPLLEVLRIAAPGFPQRLYAFIPLFAVANSALLNAIMASRLLYGIAREGLLPPWLAAVHRQRQTPYVAILTVLVLAVALALSGQLMYLAGSASVLLLGVFLLVHIAFIVIQLQETRSGGGARFATTLRISSLSAALAGVLITCGLMAFIPQPSLLRAGLMVAAGLLIVVIYWTVRRRHAAGPTTGSAAD